MIQPYGRRLVVSRSPLVPVDDLVGALALLLTGRLLRVTEEDV